MLERGRHDAGSIVAEHVAVMVLVAAVIAALFATGVVASVGEHARVATCNLFGGDCEVQLVVDDDASGDVGGEADGPLAGDAPGDGTQVDPDVLPGDPADGGTGGPGDVGPGGSSGPGGSVTFTSTEELTDHLEVSTSVTASASRPTLESDGCVRRTLGLDVTTQITASASTEVRRHLEVGLEGFTGIGSGYNVTVTAEHAERILADPREAPNPFQPTKMPVGSAIELTSETFRGYGMEAAYHVLRASLQETSGREVSFGVVRLDDGGLRLIAGEADLVSQALAFGFGTDQANVMAGVERERREGRLQVIDLDITSAAGYDTYLETLRTGQLPTSGSPGVHDRSEVELHQGSGAHVARVEVGGFSATVEGASSDHRFERTTHEDGRVTETHTTRYDDVTLIVEHGFADASSSQPQDESFVLLLQDAPPGTYEGLRGADGSPLGDLGGARNVRIDLTRDDLLTLRDQARRGSAHLNLEGSLTPMDRIASAEDHLEVLDVLLNVDLANPGSLILDGLLNPAIAASLADGTDALDVVGAARTFDACR